MLNRSYLYSGGFHVLILAVLFWSPWFHPHGPIIWDIDFQGDGGGGGNGGTGAGGRGPKASEMGQTVPQPQQIKVPNKPAPVQKETKSEETWKVKNAKTIKAETQKANVPAEDVERGEKNQKATSNVIRRGVAEGTQAGDGSFDFGQGSGGGSGGGSGTGIGIGTGSGSGSGFGFGGYLRVVRSRLMQEWTQSAVFGKNQSCIVGLTILANGDVRDIKLEKTSGNAFYDNVAMRAVRNSTPLPPLPPNFPGSEQRFRIQFRLLE